MGRGTLGFRHESCSHIYAKMMIFVFSVISFMVVFGLFFFAVRLSDWTSAQRRRGEGRTRLKTCDLSVGCGSCACDNEAGRYRENNSGLSRDLEE